MPSCTAQRLVELELDDKTDEVSEVERGKVQGVGEMPAAEGRVSGQGGGTCLCH